MLLEEAQIKKVHLCIGWAVFDQKHKLTLINPTLIDPARLRAAFLTAKTKLVSSWTAPEKVG